VEKFGGVPESSFFYYASHRSGTLGKIRNDQKLVML